MNEAKTTEQALKEVFKITKDIYTVDKLGGRNSFFGLKKIFEIYLKEEHDKMTEEEKAEDYPFSGFRGMMCYGNIIHHKYCVSAIDKCIKELGFTQEEWQSLYDWYVDSGSPDTITCGMYIKWYLKDNYKIILQ